jgi:tetratricopeptide (TPR) repeat protein
MEPRYQQGSTLLANSGKRREGLIARAVDWVFGFDFFISYSHSDGTQLPCTLKDRLTQAGFHVCLDQTDYVAGMDLTRETRRQVSRSRKLIVVARPGALKSKWVKREVDVALAKGNIPVVVNVNGAIEAALDSDLASAAREQHWLRLNVRLADADGDVPDDVVVELIRGFKHTRQETKRKRVFAAAAAVLGVTAGLAIWQAIEATQARIVAETQRDRAQRVLDQVVATSNRRVQAAAKQVASKRIEGEISAGVSTAGPSLERANTLMEQAALYIDREDIGAARRLLEMADNMLSSRPQAVATDDLWRLAQAKLNDRIGNMWVVSGDTKVAFKYLVHGLDLLAQPPSATGNVVAEWARAEAGMRQDLGDLFMAQRHAADAEKQFRHVLALRQSLLSRSPESQPARRDLAIVHTRLADALLAQSDLHGAFEAYQTALSIIEPIAALAGAESAMQRELSVVYQRMADLRLAERRYEDALVWLDKDFAMSNAIALGPPVSPILQRDLASTHDRRARTLELMGRGAEAIDEYGKGISILEAVIANADALPSWQRDAAAMLESMGKLLAKTDRPGLAVKALRRALAIRESLAASQEEASWQYELEAAYRRASETILAMGQTGEALETAEQYLLAVSLATDADEARAERIGRALGTLSWSAVNARSYQRALWAGRHAVELAPNLSWISLNYAHALMLSGDREAAKAIYLAVHKPVPQEIEAWKASLEKDFKTLRSRGIEDPLMDDIATRFRISERRIGHRGGAE